MPKPCDASIPSVMPNVSVAMPTSQQALDTLKKHAPGRAGATVQIVMADPGGMRAPDTRERVTAMLGQVGHLPHVAGVHSPYTDPAAISRDGTIAYATVTLDGQAQDIAGTDVRAIIHTAQGAAGDGLRVELGGDAVRGAEQAPGGSAEGAGLLAALVILVVLFGSLLGREHPHRHRRVRGRQRGRPGGPGLARGHRG
jgi:RND superfamily putative drug exporter